MPGAKTQSKKCGAKTRKGTPCQVTKISKENGRCRMHGGFGSGRPAIHGRHSKKIGAFRERVDELAQAIQLDPDGLRQKLGILESFIERLTAEDGPRTKKSRAALVNLTIEALKRHEAAIDKQLKSSEMVHTKELAAVMARVVDIVKVKAGAETAAAVADQLNRELLSA